MRFIQNFRELSISPLHETLLEVVEEGLARADPYDAVLTAPRLEGWGFCTLWGFPSLFRAPHGCCITCSAPAASSGEVRAHSLLNSPTPNTKNKYYNKSL